MATLLRLLLAGLLLLSLPDSLCARGASGGGGRSSGGFSGGSSSRSSGFSSSSSSSRSSSSWGSSSSSNSGSSWGSRSTGGSSSGSSGGSGSSWGSSSRFSGSSSNTSPSTGFSSSNTRTSNASQSSTDAALARKTAQSGTQFTSRSAAVADFQQKYASQYKTTFASEPAARPSYVPTTIFVSGYSYPVYYDWSYGGYGYWMGPIWHPYSPFADAVMLDALMSQHNYGYGGGYTSYSRPSASGSIFVGLLFLIFTFVLMIVVVVLIKRAIAGMHHSHTAVPPPLAVSNSPAPGTTKMDKTNPDDWLKIQPKSVITLSDAQAIADAQRRGLGVRGMDYTVSSVAHIKQLDNLSTHVFLSLADSEQNVYLMAKIVDQAMDLYAYFEVPGLAGGSRQELLDRGMQWLFQEPANPNAFDPAELRYTMTLEQKVPQEGKGDMSVNYIQKSQGELQCNYKENPPRSGLSGSLLATLVEYKAQQAVDNPEFLILEVGHNRSSQSFVQFFLGCEAKLSEVDVLAI